MYPVADDVFAPGSAPVTPLPPAPRPAKAPTGPKKGRPGPATPPPPATVPGLPSTSETTELFEVADPLATPGAPRPGRAPSPNAIGVHDLLPETGADRPPESNGPVFELCQRLVDLQAEVETSETAVAEARQLAESGGAPASTASNAAARLRAAKKKLTIAQRLFEGELNASRAEVAALQADVEHGEGADRRHAEARLLRARARLDALEAAR
jgi:hypothetical protein